MTPARAALRGRADGEVIMKNETWRSMLAAEMELRGESFRDVVFLSTSSQQFTAWTARRVYFSITHNGDEFIVSAARNPH